MRFKKIAALSLAAVMSFSIVGCSKKGGESETELGALPEVGEDVLVIDDENFKATVELIYESPEEYDGTEVNIYGMCTRIKGYTYIYRNISHADRLIEDRKIGLRYVYDRPNADGFVGEWCAIAGTLKVIPMDAYGKAYDVYIEASSVALDNFGEINIDKFNPTEPATELPTNNPEFEFGEDYWGVPDPSATKPTSPPSTEPPTQPATAAAAPKKQ